jgi:hypothetical protein
MKAGWPREKRPMKPLVIIEADGEDDIEARELQD